MGRLTWSGLSPVKQNIPIWSVMCDQLWDEPGKLNKNIYWVLQAFSWPQEVFISSRLATGAHYIFKK